MARRKEAPRRRTDALEWVRRVKEENQRQREEATAKRLATRARNAEARPRSAARLPADGKAAAAFYLPVSLDLDAYPERLKWYAAYFLNLIHWRWVCWRANEQGYVQLLYSLLEKIIPRVELKEVKETLIAQGVVECDEESRRSRKAHGYRITPGYRETRRVVCSDDDLNRKIRRVYAKEDRATLPVHRWLKSKLEALDFDMNAAMPIIKRLRPRRTSGLSVAEYRLKIAGHCQRLAHRDHWFSCDEYGRVHTPVTSLPRELRRCLSVGGQPLVGLDLANSQPLLLGVFGRRYFGSPMERSRFLKKTFGDRTRPYCTQEVRAMTGRPTQELPADMDKYLRVCERGKFYESLMTEEQKARGKKFRRRFKQLFYLVLFGRNVVKGRYPNHTRARFRHRYPSAAKVLRALKKRNYKHSSHVLQNYESTLFIDIICGRIMRERPDASVFTIHDSILTTPDAADYVRAVVLDELKKLGVSPTLRRERHDDPA